MIPSAIGTDLWTVPFGWPLGGGLWEVRSSLPSQRMKEMMA